MVERSDEAPLLFWAEGPAVSAPPPAAEPGSSGSSGGRRLGGGWSAAPWDGEGPAEAAGPPRAEAEEDQIVAVFVVTFDPRTGERRRERAVRGAGAGPGALPVPLEEDGCGRDRASLGDRSPRIPPPGAGPSARTAAGVGTGGRGHLPKTEHEGMDGFGSPSLREEVVAGGRRRVWCRSEERDGSVSSPQHREFVDGAGASPVPPI